MSDFQFPDIHITRDRIGPEEYDPYWDEVDHFFEGHHVGPSHYDMDGNPISMRAWVAIRQWSEWQLAREYIHIRDGIRYWISTVWLGIDHGMRWAGDPNYRPLIFETMIFTAVPGPWHLGYGERAVVGASDEACWRWSTKGEALVGHERIVAAMRAGALPGDDILTDVTT